MRQHIRHGGTTVRLTNIQTVRDRNGKPRRYLRVKGQKLVPLPDLPLDHPDFLAAWSAAMKAAKGRPARPAPGSIAALCGEFLRSPAFRAHSAGYQSILRRHVMAIEARAGEAQARHLDARHIAVDLAGLTGGAAQSRYKAWRALTVHGLDAGILQADPTEGVKRPKPARTDGHAPWTAAEIEAFRTRWQIGTVQRAIVELLYWTGARISDAVRLGRGMVDRDGVLRFRQQKTGGLAFIPWTCPLPDYAAGMEADRQAMHEALVACAGHMTFLATRDGRTRSAKAIGGDVAKSARLAGVEKTAHGLRKSRSAVLAEAGASAHQIAAWTGHESLSEVAHYTRSADKRRAVMGTNEEGTVANPADPVGKSARK